MFPLSFSKTFCEHIFFGETIVVVPAVSKSGPAAWARRSPPSLCRSGAGRPGRSSWPLPAPRAPRLRTSGGSERTRLLSLLRRGRRRPRWRSRGRGRPRTRAFKKSKKRKIIFFSVSRGNRIRHAFFKKICAFVVVNQNEKGKGGGRGREYPPTHPPGRPKKCSPHRPTTYLLLFPPLTGWPPEAAGKKTNFLIAKILPPFGGYQPHAHL